jgi:hypothetical protein
MALTPAMRSWFERHRGDRADDLFERFLDAFDLDDGEGEALFSEGRRAAGAAAPRAAAPGRGGPGAGRAASAAMLDEADVTAPFRFVALNDTVVGPEPAVLAAWEDGRLHDRPLPGGLSGRIAVTVTCDGPLLVGGAEGDQSPARLGADYVIPGATLRGLTRATLETAAFARLSQTNLHRRYGIRDFDHMLFRDEARADLRAGWLRCVNPEAEEGERRFEIAPCRWWAVRIRDLPGVEDSGAGHLAWLGLTMAQRYGALGMGEGPFDFGRAALFAPAAPGPGGVPRVTPGDGPIRGVYVCANRSPTLAKLTAQTLDDEEAAPRKGAQKKTEAVFADAPDGPPLEVPAQVWRDFAANNSRPSRRRPTPVGNWAVLAAQAMAGGRVPVFWVADAQERVADLGLTRAFKRAHRFTQGDVLARSGGGAHVLSADAECFKPDFVEALFGFVHEPETAGGMEAQAHGRRHLKARARFGFARLDPATPARLSEPVRTVMGAPKPSFGPFYLAGTGNKDWSDEGARLAGRKVYPARGHGAAAVRAALEAAAGNAQGEAGTTLRFLEPARGGALRFHAELRLHNVTEAEAGAVLWALTLGGVGTRRHMIGRAKAAGAGQARIDAAPALSRHVGGPAPEAAELLAAFEAFIGTRVPGWRDSPPLCDLLRASDPEWGGKPARRLAYLGLQRHRALRKAVYGRDAAPAVNRTRPRLLDFEG